jgi:hypothetical protein
VYLYVPRRAVLNLAMTTKPSRSQFVHSGFVDLVNLVASTPSRLGLTLANSRFFGSSPPGSPPLNGPARGWNRGGGGVDEEVIGVPYDRMAAWPNVDPNDRAAAVGKILGMPSSSPVNGMPRVGVERPAGVERHAQAAVVELRKRKVDKRIIGVPTDFRRVGSAIYAQSALSESHPPLIGLVTPLTSLPDTSSTPRLMRKPRKCFSDGQQKESGTRLGVRAVE